MTSTLRASFVLTLLLLVASGASAAEEDSTFVGWRKSLTADITVTQTGYSDSWTGDEVSSFNWVSNLNGTAEKQLAPWFDFKSTLKISFGQTITQDTTSDGGREWGDWRKSTDLIDWENVGLFTLHQFVDPYVAFRLETRFYDGSNADKKLWFSPLRLTESAGIARKFYTKEDDFVLSRLGLAVRETFISSIADPVTLKTTDTTLTDGGLESVTDVSLTLHQNILYTAKLTLYRAFFFSRSDEVKGTEYEDFWKAVDVAWENILAAQVTKFVTVNLYTQILYDKEISRKGRFKETVAIGLAFKLI
ncbi:MAG: hypothetical protein JSV52_06560 [Candidatus Zixiibacteriota bacterium]|nr:MAG: hypothetical protein JSV52_06560 [candidate division Zixibacteria bacterium]